MTNDVPSPDAAKAALPASPTLKPPIAEAAPHAAPARDVIAASAPKRPHRTLGLKMVDALVYPVLNNFAVFGVSVAATYLTSKGGPDAAGNLPYGKTGKFFFERGEKLKTMFGKIGIPEQYREGAKMVFFSFADGTIIAPFVKILEDHREHMAKWLDTHLGTKPKDERVYEAEPKQTWGSVIEGRLLTSLIVVPTAVFLGKTGLNQKLFETPGLKTGEWIASKPNMAKRFGSIDIPELFKTVYFEAFYTSVCTAGLYFISRFIAKRHDKHVAEAAPLAPVIAMNTAPEKAAPDKETPSSQISQGAQVVRLQPLPTAHEIRA